MAIRRLVSLRADILSKKGRYSLGSMLVRAATACARLRSYLDGVKGAVVVEGVQKVENIW